jgi:lipoprotein-anchoring transpeptidase ErfK/SrfK
MVYQFKKLLLPGVIALLFVTLLFLSPFASTKSHAAATYTTAASTAQGKVIVVSLSGQWLYAYENGRSVFSTPVMTGRSVLATPAGTYHVFSKKHPTWFRSPWPHGSPYWYPATYINYALEWRAGGFYLHDATWHSTFGPGTNGWHYDPQFGWQWGSHGCIGMSLGAAAWLYRWAPIGTTVQIKH